MFFNARPLPLCHIMQPRNSGDVFEAGDDVRVEWDSSLESSYFDVSLLNDGAQVLLLISIQTVNEETYE